ncbi:hypothetical protein ABZX51_010573 [Aspergillus tubingensis]
MCTAIEGMDGPCSNTGTVPGHISSKISRAMTENNWLEVGERSQLSLTHHSLTHTHATHAHTWASQSVNQLSRLLLSGPNWPVPIVKSPFSVFPLLLLAYLAFSRVGDFALDLPFGLALDFLGSTVCT